MIKARQENSQAIKEENGTVVTYHDLLFVKLGQLM